MKYLLLLCFLLTSCHGFIHTENDYFSGWSKLSDRYYTNGVKFGIIEETDTTRETYAVGQNVYTPSSHSKNASILSLKESRPYTGYLYGEYLNTKQTTPIIQDTFGIQLGCVGACSYARQTQQEFHRLINQSHPTWQRDFRQRSEPVATLILERRRSFLAKSLNNYFQTDLQGYAGVKVGNLIDNVALGGNLRLGYNLPQFRPDEIIFKKVKAPQTTDPYSAYLSLKAEDRLVAYNHLLQGSFLQSERHRVKHDWNVGEFGAGLTLGFKQFKLTYTYSYISREWTTERGGFVFGGVDIEW